MQSARSFKPLNGLGHDNDSQYSVEEHDLFINQMRMQLSVAMAALMGRDGTHIAQYVWRTPAAAKHHRSKTTDVSHSSILPGTRAQEEEVYED